MISPTPEQIRERLAKIAPVPWRSERVYDGGATVAIMRDWRNAQGPAAAVQGPEGWIHLVDESTPDRNADFIANAPTDIAFLLSLLDQRDAEIAELKNAAIKARILIGSLEDDSAFLRGEREAAESSLLRMTEERNEAQLAAAEWREKLASVMVENESLRENNGSVKALFDERAVSLARLTEEWDLLRTSGIIEVAIRNPNVSSYMDHWEGRTLKAETSLARLTEAHERLKWENAAIRRFADLHTGGCQSPHGGKCGCGWSLIEARLEELSGEESRERVAWLRSTVAITYPSDKALVEEVLADLDALLAPHEEKKDDE